jgi:two-component SAPR family response regulator
MSARILVLEDDSHLRNIMVRVLSHQGFEVVSASRAQEAVELATKERFDLLIADIRMEGMDGLEAVRLTKEQHPEIGSLIVSGYASEEETVRAERLQVGGYLKKPFRTSVLLKHVRELLAEKANVLHRQSQSDIDREYLVWALEQFLRHADIAGEAGPPGWLNSVCERAGWLGRETGMVANLAQELSLGAGLLAWSRVTGETIPEVTHKTRLLPTFQVIFKDRSESEPTSLEFSLVDLAVLIAEFERDHGKSPTSAQVEENFPGRFSPELLSTLSKPFSSSPPPEEETVTPGRSGISLLSLARALERGGDLEGAERAYLELSCEESASDDGVRALLAAGRLAHLSGRTKEALERLDKARSEAPKLGPTLHALARLEWGLMAAQTKKKKEAKKCLIHAVSYLKDLELWADWSRGVLALARLGEVPDEPTIQRIVQLADRSGAYLYGNEVLANLVTLLGLYEGEILTDPIPFSSLVQYAPARLEKLLLELSDDHRVTLCRALTESSRPCPEELVRALQHDQSPEVRGLAKQLSSSTTEVVSAQAIRIFSLGVFQVFRGEERVADLDFKTQKNRYLLAYLSAEKGRPRRAEALVELFWPGKGQKGKNSLNWAVSVLRSIFRTPSSNVLVRDADKLLFDPSIPRWHDLDELEEAVKEARKAEQDGDKTLAWQKYRRAAELYRGDYLEGCFMDWALQRRTRISNVMAEAFLRLAVLSEGAGQMAEAETAINNLLKVQPHSQKGHLFKVQLLTRQGEPERAIDHYRRCEELLRVEYQLEPSTDLLRAYHEARLAL